MQKSRRRAPKPEIEAIVFDIGRVIIHLDPSRAIAAIGAASELKPEKLWDDVHKDSLWDAWQEGRVPPRQWHKNLCARFGTSLSFDEFCEVWNSSLSPKTILSDQFFRQLSKKHRLVLLSNTDPIHVACMEANFKFIRYFPKRIYSCEVGASKPSLKIFRAAIRAAAAPPNRILFIDDILQYVRAARRAGLQSLQFRSRAQLEAALRRLKLLP